MRAYELIELSALIAVNGRAFIRGGGRLSDRGISQYWSVSRSRFDRWAHALRGDLGRLQSGETKATIVWRRARPVLEEILTGEILTRIWTAVACERDRQWGASYVSPVIRSVFLGHLEARHRALNFMFHAQDHDSAAVRDINRVRNRSERWTDMLLAYLTSSCDITTVAHDRKRVADFADDVDDQFHLPQAEQAWRLLRAGLQSSFGRSLAKTPPNGDLNAQIASTILACYRPDMFDATVELDSLWMGRLEYTAADAEALFDELLALDGPEDALAWASARHPPTPIRAPS